MSFSIDALLNLIQQLIDRLGAKTFVAVAGIGLIGYLMIAWHLDGRPWPIVVSVIGGVVIIVALHFYARINETKIKGGLNAEGIDSAAGNGSGK